MTVLTDQQVKQYNDQGYISPIDALTEEEVTAVREEIEFIEKQMPNEIDKSGRYNVHLISPKLDKIVHHSKILDAVESVIGKNILVCSTTLFIKNVNQEGFVSYHQDAKYIGLKPHNWVSAWVAITDSYEENGCMRMWPGSHLKIKDHEEKFDKGNLLTRGQTVENVPKNKIKPVELKAGQASLHHPRIVHGSGVNRSNDRRIGFVIQSYIGTNVKQTLGRNGVQLARGVDKFQHHEHLGRVKSLMSKDGMALRKRENEFLQKIFYKGSSKKSEF
ncbi:MAG: phytanoyl-CoA dioxygenase family protein [Flavobacteriaceae bacterium]|jgi:non-haem Fe2+, alpha-ketoglutarate-dependent halogenase|nr:phytanoyl-CoA dioxygenase family protein [Flavobacteriaceae bacterium]